MNISKLMGKSEKRLDISEWGEQGDFITLLLFPFRIKNEIEKLKLKGIDMSDIIDNVLESEDLNKVDEKSIINDMKSKKLKVKFKDDYDNGAEYKLKLLEYGVDKNNHSLIDENGKSLVLSSDIWEKLGSQAPNFFNFVINEVEKYQDEFLEDVKKKYSGTHRISLH